MCLRSWDDEYKIIEKVKCLKCCDRYIPSHGGFSQRKSCRCHDFKNGVCRDCRETKETCGITCYHQAYH